MPGTVAQVAVAKGDLVAAGAEVVVLEAMKMEHVVTAPAPGVVTELAVRPGQPVDAGTELARVEPAADGAARPPSPASSPAGHASPADHASAES
jgi:pyruvate/2-oxoglutarate dehydrogenase complex dihydrolipoamide acyltransferase (E2) component